MPVLYVLDGPELGRTVELSAAAVLGRGEECDVRLRGRSVSREHARLEPIDGRWVLVDLGSSNGVRVNDEPVERAELADGDEIVLGELPLRFRLEPGPADAPQPPARAALDDIELEEEIELETEPAPPAPRRLDAPADEPRAPAPVVARASERYVERGAERAELLRRMDSARGGFFSGELAQQPLFVRMLAYALVLVLAAAVVAGAYVAVRRLRSGM